ncbi:hypothetical protein QJS66_17915 [Kocuria rhizophila]|nr:hypothetical protein QJS66_17915 [Kocuria rhizophila]
MLTSIVISLATTAFLLSIIWRSWILARRREGARSRTTSRTTASRGGSSYDAEDDDAIPQDASEFATPDAPSPSRRDAEEASEWPGHHRVERSCARTGGIRMSTDLAQLAPLAVSSVLGAALNFVIVHRNSCRAP